MKNILRHSHSKRFCNPHIILLCLCQSRCHKLTYLGRVMSFSSEMRAFNPVIRKVRLHGCDLVHELTRTQIAMSLHYSRSCTYTYMYTRARVVCVYVCVCVIGLLRLHCRSRYLHLTRNTGYDYGHVSDRTFKMNFKIRPWQTKLKIISKMSPKLIRNFLSVELFKFDFKFESPETKKKKKKWSSNHAFSNWIC